MAEENDGAVDVQQEEAAGEQTLFQADSASQETEQPNGADTLEHWKSMSRRNEREAKAARTELAAMKEANAKALADLEASKARVAELEASAAYEAAVREVAAATGYPEAVVRGLRGSTAEELTECVEALRANLSMYPPSRDGGEPSKPAAPSTSQQFAKALESFL